jgi:hypothetical protein
VEEKRMRAQREGLASQEAANAEEIRLREVEWVQARQAVDAIEQTARAAAELGQRRATVYSTKNTKYFKWENRKKGFWKPKDVATLTAIPDFAKYVADECRRHGFKTDVSVNVPDIYWSIEVPVKYTYLNVEISW